MSSRPGAALRPEGGAGSLPAAGDTLGLQTEGISLGKWRGGSASSPKWEAGGYDYLEPQGPGRRTRTRRREVEAGGPGSPAEAEVPGAGRVGSWTELFCV